MWVWEYRSTTTTIKMAGENLKIRAFLKRINDPVMQAVIEAIFNDLLFVLSQGGGGGIGSVVAGVGISIDNTDPANPIITFDPQTYMETLPSYIPDADNQAIIRLADGSFDCAIVDIQ